MLSIDNIKTKLGEHQEMLNDLVKYLRVLERKQAKMGVNTPVHIEVEIDEYLTKISEQHTAIAILLIREKQVRENEHNAFMSMLSVIENDAASVWIFQSVVSTLSYHNILGAPFYIADKLYVLIQMKRNVENECKRHILRLENEIEEIRQLMDAYLPQHPGTAA